MFPLAVEKGGKTGYAFVFVTGFDLAGARGMKQRYTHMLRFMVKWRLESTGSWSIPDFGRIMHVWTLGKSRTKS